MKTTLPIIDLTKKQMERVLEVKRNEKKSMAQYIRDLIDTDIEKSKIQGGNNNGDKM